MVPSTVRNVILKNFLFPTSERQFERPNWFEVHAFPACERETSNPWAIWRMYSNGISPATL